MTIQERCGTNMTIQERRSKNIFGEQLKKLRKSMNKNQGDIAEMTGLSQSAISNYENGKMIPTIDVAAHIAEACNVPLTWLTGDDDNVSMRTMGDVASFLLDFYSVEQFRCKTTANTEEENGARSTQLTFFPNDNTSKPTLCYSAEICDLLQAAADLTDQLSTYACTQENYDKQRAILIEKYSALPISLLNHAGLSENERIRLYNEKMKEQLKEQLREEVRRELLQEMKNRENL